MAAGQESRRVEAWFSVAFPAETLSVAVLIAGVDIAGNMIMVYFKTAEAQSPRGGMRNKDG